jgi:hypothetical protein
MNKAETLIRLVFQLRKVGHSGTMLKKTDRLPGEATLIYLDGDIKLESPGDFVVCAVTSRKIPLQALRYWCVDRQEAYVDAAAASARMIGDR